MEKCCICSRKIGGWGEDKYIVDENKDLVCCYQCASLIRNIESAETADMFSARLEEFQQKIRKNNVPLDIQEAINNKIDQLTTAKRINGVVNDVCPICGNMIDIEGKGCPVCGYKYLVNERVYTSKEHIDIYNNRHQQYVKNSMYEYAVEIIQDSAVYGCIDKKELESTLANYAMNGWRLHTVFTNEIGKNSVMGINSTVEQSILIFERCIKSGEN